MTTEIVCCGEPLLCSGMTTTCPECYADYDSRGNRLAPRNLWDGTDGAGSPGYE